MALKQDELIKIVEKILSLDEQMRFAAIIDLKGSIVEGIMKEGKSSLESQKQEELFCKQVADRRKMRELFNDELGQRLDPLIGILAGIVIARWALGLLIGSRNQLLDID